MWIAHYKDGTTINEKAGIDWLDIPKKDITSIQVKDEKSGLIHTLSLKDKPLAYFQYKSTLKNIYTQQEYKEYQRIGAIVNKEGDCVILELNYRTGQVKLIHENVYNLNLNLKLFGIEL